MRARAAKVGKVVNGFLVIRVPQNLASWRLCGRNSESEKSGLAQRARRTPKNNDISEGINRSV
jgi:hypothetical protein